ncbi:FecR family protein [Rugamonas apoptosis]|uniref:FecR domain-containing protein n=1 Tax=Rugamonas apoptosis TaxID=2758570 RepID=A0A7W2FAA1_9BURK|nr:FecR family protein [Rugamonas apoptosis]MBA5687986.1 FecR domain-containing protein [Rugamonas apoptosis]
MLRQILVSLSVGAGLLWSAAAMAGEAGKVVFVTGQVQLAKRAAVLDAAVQEGDEVATGADGYVYIKTVDAGFLILRPNSKARIAAYQVDQQNPGNTHVKLELLGGVARSISGTAVKKARQNFRFNTPVAAIGVRGTDFIVYTDQETSRVAVVSGGVVVSGFSGGCGPEGNGPCEGNASRELFAGQSGVLLQVQRGQNIPQLLRNPSLAPDQSMPPRGDEPVGKVTPATSLPVAVQDVNLDAQKGAGLLNAGKAASGNNTTQTGTDTGAKVPPAEVVVDPGKPVVPPAPPSPPEILWGRWQAVADVPQDAAALAKLRDGTFENTYTAGGAYVIARLKNSQLVMPKDGTAAFVLSGSEATLQLAGQNPVAAAIRDAHLDVNFGSRSFSTGLTVYTPDASMAVAGQGSITSVGGLVSDLGADMTIRGYLGGSQAEQAGYVFKTINNPKMTAEGATTWKH